MLTDLRNLLEFTHKYQCSSEICQFVVDRFKDHQHDFDPLVVIRLGKEFDVPELLEVGANQLEEQGIKWEELCTCDH